MRWTGQIFWLLAFEEVERFVVERLRETEKPFASQLLNPSTPQLILHLLPAFTADSRRTIGSWEVVSSYSSATAPDSHGISCADPLFQARKELRSEVVACASRLKIYLSIKPV
jgi:hypothetical protein